MIKVAKKLSRFLVIPLMASVGMAALLCCCFDTFAHAGQNTFLSASRNSAPEKASCCNNPAQSQKANSKECDCPQIQGSALDALAVPVLGPQSGQPLVWAAPVSSLRQGGAFERNHPQEIFSWLQTAPPPSLYILQRTLRL